MSRQTSGWNRAGAAVIVLAVLAAGAYRAHRAMVANAPLPAPAPAPVAAASTAPSIRSPIAQAASGPAAAASTPLPTLERSDDRVAAALEALAGGNGLRALLVPRQIIARIVATIDALPRHAIGSRILPLQTPQGAFLADQADGVTVISARNAARYAPYMRIVDSVDPKALVAWYVRYYPLFQQAYRQLGYPRGYFNDRLIAVIDDLLAAPDRAQPPALELRNGRYVYVDPALESLSVGQKLMIRVGPADAARIKAKLRAIRADLTGAALPAHR
ncbi:MAG: DUF3014 domain-containing protein [Xanthomonadaceae bacterium]|nr:DUF3014 domain-containing protein [Xanthomonadaceae bacterium]